MLIYFLGLFYILNDTPETFSDLNQFIKCTCVHKCNRVYTAEIIFSKLNSSIEKQAYFLTTVIVTIYHLHNFIFTLETSNQKNLSNHSGLLILFLTIVKLFALVVTHSLVLIIVTKILNKGKLLKGTHYKRLFSSSIKKRPCDSDVNITRNITVVKHVH